MELSDEKAKSLMMLKERVNKSKHFDGVPVYRRVIRRQLFGIRDGYNDLDNGLKEVIESQFKKNLQQNWDTFTFTWDVSPIDPFKVITKEEWSAHGGKIDIDTGIRIPAGFTEQEK